MHGPEERVSLLGGEQRPDAGLPRLETDHRCDVAVLGGGITGALIADELAAATASTWRSSNSATSAGAAQPPARVAAVRDRHPSGRPGQASRRSRCRPRPPRLRRRHRPAACGRLGVARRASRATPACTTPAAAATCAQLEEEHAARRRHGPEVELLDAERVQEDYGFDAPAALAQPAGRARGSVPPDPSPAPAPAEAGLRCSTGRASPRSGRRRVASHCARNPGSPCAPRISSSRRDTPANWLKKSVARNRSAPCCHQRPAVRAALGFPSTIRCWKPRARISMRAARPTAGC